MKYFSLVLFLVAAYVSHAHAYYFSFAEMEFNAETKRFEVSVQTSAHDTEFSMEKQGVPVKDLEMQTKDEVVKKGLESWINRGFQVFISNHSIVFRLVGYEVLPNGLLYAYLESEPVEEAFNELHIMYDLLMDDFPQQQNKITFIYKSLKQTAVFLPSRKEETLKISS